MRLSSKNILSLFALLIPFHVFAQQPNIQYRNRLGDSLTLINTAVKPPKIKAPRQLKGEISGGIKLNSDGYGIFVDKGWLKGGDDFGQENKDKLFNERLVEFELIERKNSKEKSNDNDGYSGSYILGKINYFFAFKAGYGRRKLIAGKPESGTFSVHWVYLGGITVGLLKPYYLNIYGEGNVKYVNDSISLPNFVDPNYIEGHSSFFQGIGQTKIVPGLYAKTGLHFDFSNKRKALWAIEVGAEVEGYSQKIEQMVWSNPQSVFYNFYAAFSFGKLR